MLLKHIACEMILQTQFSTTICQLINNHKISYGSIKYQHTQCYTKYPLHEGIEMDDFPPKGGKDGMGKKFALSLTVLE